MAKNLLLEIGCEELPASYVPLALKQLQEIAAQSLTTHRIFYKSIHTDGTCRRLILFATDVEEMQRPKKSIKIGPPVAQVYDKEGRLLEAGIKFMKAIGVKKTDLFPYKTEKGEYIAVSIEEPRKKTKEILRELIPQWISEIKFPSSMRWDGGKVSFGRPIRWIMCLFGNQIIRFRVGSVVSSNRTYPHRLFPSSKFCIVKSADYQRFKTQLYRLHVMLETNERKRRIIQLLKKHRVTNYSIELVNTVVYLVEFPEAIKGNFPSAYLTLPKEVLITCMQHHLRYFPIIDNNGNLQPYFIVIHNGLNTKKAIANIKKGSERVLLARFSDAQFFWQEDTKTSLESKRELLRGITFIERFNYYEKAERIVKISEFIASKFKLAEDIKARILRAAFLCKADLVTQMVKEFPELEGVAGKFYALYDKENSIVAQAIYEHWLPSSSKSDELPSTLEGSILSISDKFDTILSCFAVNLSPTGSSDPYGLRRAATAIIRIFFNHPDWSLSLKELVNFILSILNKEEIKDLDFSKVSSEVINFFKQRFKSYLLETTEISFDIIDAILATFPEDELDINNAKMRTEMLAEFRKSKEFYPLVIACKRVVNILAQAKKKFGIANFNEPDISKFIEPAEIELFNAINKIRQSSESLSAENFYSALLNMAELRSIIDQFFEKVLVMENNEDLRYNRLALLAKVASYFKQLADFSLLTSETEGTVSGRKENP